MRERKNRSTLLKLPATAANMVQKINIQTLRALQQAAAPLAAHCRQRRCNE